MDPLSITVASLSLAKMCGTVGFELALLIQEGGNIGVAIAALQTDVTSFETVLNLLHETVNNADVKSWLDGQARLGTYWENVAVSLEDARTTLQALSDVVTKINKPTKMMDTVRKQVRLKFAADEIVIYRQQISRFKDTVQVVLNTTTIWHQVSDKEVSEKVIPRLDETQDMIRQLGMQLNARMAALQTETESQIQALSIASKVPSSQEEALDTISSVQTIEKLEYKTLNNMRECLKGAASVISSASTTVGRRVVGDASTVYGSDFGDVFPVNPSDRTLAWIESNTIAESDEGYATKSETSHGMLFSEAKEPDLANDLEFDPELELEMLQACYDRAKHLHERDQHEEAETLLRDCTEDLKQLKSCPSSIAHQVLHLAANATECLISALLAQAKLADEPELIRRMLHIHALLPNADPMDQLGWTLNLAYALYNCKEYEEVLLHCRRIEAELRKRGNEGLKDRIAVLKLMEGTYSSIGRKRESDRCKVLTEHLESSLKNNKEGLALTPTDHGEKVLSRLRTGPSSRSSSARNALEKFRAPASSNRSDSGGLEQRTRRSEHPHTARASESDQVASGLTYRTIDGKTVSLIAVSRRRIGLLAEDRFSLYLPAASFCESGEELQVLRFTPDKFWIVARRSTGYEGLIELKHVYLRSVVVEEKTSAMPNRDAGPPSAVPSRTHAQGSLARHRGRVDTYNATRELKPPQVNHASDPGRADPSLDEITVDFDNLVATLDDKIAANIRSLGLRRLKPGERSTVKANFSSGAGSPYLQFSSGDEIEILLRTHNQLSWWYGRIGKDVGMFPSFCDESLIKRKLAGTLVPRLDHQYWAQRKVQ